MDIFNCLALYLNSYLEEKNSVFQTNSFANLYEQSKERGYATQKEIREKMEEIKKPLDIAESIAFTVFFTPTMALENTFIPSNVRGPSTGGHFVSFVITQSGSIYTFDHVSLLFYINSIKEI